MSNVRLLSRQPLPLRGDGDEMDSNFTQLLKLPGEDDPIIFEWIKKKTDKYTSGEMQNEMIKSHGFPNFARIGICTTKHCLLHHHDR